MGNETLRGGVNTTKTLEKWLENFKSETNREKEDKLQSIKEKGYEIMKQIGDEKTGFSMTVMKNINEQGKERYTFAIRGTDDRKDVIGSDTDIGMKRLPEQMISLVRTLSKDEDVKKILSNKDNEIEVIGHSLGGNLAQIMTALYPDRVKQTYSFNGPGVKNLGPLDTNELTTLSKKDKELYEVVLKAQQRFFENIHNPKYRFTNVMNVVNKDKIGNFGTHLGLKTAEFGTSSHFLRDLRGNVEKLSEAE
ncbi:MAG: Mbeg1-like protein, partial [Candidatus Gracilibacteria bacterium]